MTYAECVDCRRLRFPEFDGERITVRLRHRDRQQLRRAAEQTGVSESDLVREGVSVVIAAILEADEGPRAASASPGVPA